MASYTISSNSIKDGYALYSDDANTDYTIDTGVFVMSTDNSTGTYLTGADHDLLVRGVTSGSNGVIFGGVATNSSLTVAQSGLVIGTTTGASIGGDSEIINRGEIRGGVFGTVQSLGSTGDAVIRNAGLIEGGSTAIRVNGVPDSAGGAVIVNTGTVRGTWAIFTDEADDRVINRGVLDGMVTLGEGDDFFDTRTGTVNAQIDGGGGTDTFRMGAAREIVNGGTGQDTLDFRSGAGLRVSLLDLDGSSNTGRAHLDVYTDIEAVWGSAKGADRIVGNDANNTLRGFGGGDVLKGGLGNDILEGGAGIDTIRGGADSDAFVFAKPGHAGDALLDFASGTDQIWIGAAGFGGDAVGLFAGNPVTNAQFDAQLSRVAATDDVRFIWETDSTRLWFDADGKGGAASVLLADLQDKASLAAGDLVLL